jgi:putative addiction module CopG family antidote
MNLNVRVGGSLSDFVGQNVGDEGDYDNVSEYIRDLIRQDKMRKEEILFLRLKAELQRAFSAPESEYVTFSAKEFITRT